MIKYVIYAIVLCLSSLHAKAQDTSVSAGKNVWAVYFEDNYTPAWNPVYVWIWDGSDSTKNYTGGSGNWPGVAMEHIGEMWRYTFTTDDTIVTPMVLFSDGKSGQAIPADQTNNFDLANDGVYNRDGFVRYIGEESASVAEKYFTNLDFEQSTASDAPGWSAIATAQSGSGPTTTSGYDHFTVGGSWFYTVNAGTGTGHSDTPVLYQRSAEKLPAGRYTLSATIGEGDSMGWAKAGKASLLLYAYGVNDGNYTADKATQPVNYYAKNNDNTAGITSLTFELSEEEYVEIGVRTISGFDSSWWLWLYADNFNITDNELSITVSEANYATFYSDHSYILPANLTAAVANGYSASADGSGYVKLDWKYDGGDKDTSVVPGHTAVLVKAAQDGANEYKAHVVKDNAPADPDNAGNLLYGSMTQTVTNVGGATDGYFFYKLAYDNDGQNLGFYWGGSDITDGGAFTSEANKAWLAIPRSADVKLSGLIIGGGDSGLTGIVNAAPERHAYDGGAVYNLQGIRVKDMSRKGIYISGGRKIVK